MRSKIILITGLIIIILLVVLFGSGIKEKALKGIVDDIPSYDCGEDNLCTSCIIEGYSCSCGQHTCDCGDKTVDKKECVLSNTYKELK